VTSALELLKARSPQAQFYEGPVAIRGSTVGSELRLIRHRYIIVFPTARTVGQPRRVRAPREAHG
jgi:hypothetical protein